MPRLIHTLLVVAALLGAAVLSGQETIKIGEFASLTGKEAGFGNESHNGTLLAVEEINAAGGVLGRQLELIVGDNQSKNGESATVVKKLISRDKVVAILGEVASSRSLEAAPIAQRAKIPMVTPSSTNPRVTETGDYIFRVCFIDPFQGTVLAKFVKDTLKLKRVAIMTSVSSAYSVGLTKFFKERFIADGGVIVAEQKYNEGDKDFRAQLTAIKASGAEAIFASGYYTESALMAVQARQLGLDLPLFGGDGWDNPALLEIGGAAMEGTYFSTHFAADNPSPAVQGFISRYQKRFNGLTPGAMACLGYDSVFILADAIKRAGSTDPKKVRDALAETKNFEAVSGRTTIDEKRNASKAAVVLTIKDGKYKFVESIAP